MLSIDKVISTLTDENVYIIFNEESYITASFIPLEDNNSCTILFKDENDEFIWSWDIPFNLRPKRTKMIGDIVMITFSNLIYTNIIYWIDLKTGECKYIVGTFLNPLFDGNVIHYFDLIANKIRSWNIEEDTTTSHDIPAIVCTDHLDGGDFKYEVRLVRINSELLILVFTEDDFINSMLYNLEGELVNDQLPTVQLDQKFLENPSFCQDGSYYYVRDMRSHFEKIVVELSNIVPEEREDINIEELLTKGGYKSFKRTAIVNTFKNDNTTSVWMQVSFEKDEDEKFMLFSSKARSYKSARK